MKVFGILKPFFQKGLKRVKGRALAGFGPEVQQSKKKARPLHTLQVCFRECLAAKLTAAPLKRTPFSPAESAKLNGQQPSGDSIAGK